MRASCVACFLVLSHCVGVSSVRRDLAEKTSSGNVDIKHIIGQNGKSSSALQRLLSLQGQRITPAVAEELESVKSQLDGDVSQQIVTSHDGANLAIANIVGKMTAEFEIIKKSLSDSEVAHKSWTDCVQAEKAELSTYYDEMDILSTSQSHANDMANNMRQAGPFADKTTQLTLKCNIATSGDCLAEINELRAAKASAVGVVETAMQAKETIFLDAKGKSKDADTAVKDQEAKAQAQYDTTYLGKAAECATKLSDRNQMICNTLGTELKKGHKFEQDYNTTLDGINAVNGGALSHPDRVVEWKSTKTASCLIGDFLASKPIDSASIGVCSADVNFERDVGTIDPQSNAVSNIISSGKFPCRDGDSVSYDKNWIYPDVSAAGKRTTSQYEESNGWIATTDFNLPSAFVFCES